MYGKEGLGLVNGFIEELGYVGKWVNGRVGVCSYGVNGRVAVCR